MAQWSIDRLEISGGFLADTTLRLPLGLICVIGPRGSGKSTLAEAIRLVLCGPPQGAAKPRLDLIKANLGGSVLTLSTGEDSERAGFTIRRPFGQPAVLTAADGRPVTAIDLDRGTFLPIDVFSSQDIEAIADEALGSKRRSLLDELCATEMQRVHLQLSDQRRAIEANADSIQAVQRRIADLTEQIEEIGDAQGRLSELPPVSTGEGTPQFQAASRQRQINEREAVGVQQASDATHRCRSELEAALANARTRLTRPMAVSESANAPVLQQAEQAIAAQLAEAEQDIRSADQILQGLGTALAGIRETLQQAHAAQESAYLTLQQENQEAVRAVEARTAAEREVAALAELTLQRAQASEELERLLEARKALKGDYLLVRDKIAGLREAVAERLQGEAGTKVRVRVQRNADVLEYQQRLLTALHGSKLKNQDDILRSLTRIRPEELAQIVRDDDLIELESHAAFGKERSRKILDALRQGINPLVMEMLPIEDGVSIELNVATGETPNFKDASELSRGQKCTALLPILLARRDTPLVIDQPEDNLDNHFIYETVVESIRRLKHRRQMVFITHNANIPVLGEAELVVVMNSDGKRGYVEKAGTVDECRAHIIDLLEGGEEAFEMRRKRYGS